MIFTIIIINRTIIMGLKNIHFYENKMKMKKNSIIIIELFLLKNISLYFILKNYNYVKNWGYNILCDKHWIMQSLPIMYKLWYLLFKMMKITVEIPKILLSLYWII